MADVYSIITEVDGDVVDLIGKTMEVRAADPRQQAMLADYLAEIDFPPGARVLEIGCGTGAIARVLAGWPGVAVVLGVDPSPGLLAQARELAAGIGNLSFDVADGRALPLPSDGFDVVVTHTVLSHVQEPERLIAEAFRVLKPAGTFAVFDGDYCTLTVASTGNDPLQACADAFLAGFIHDPWIVRRLPMLVGDAGFVHARLRSHGYVQVTEPHYLLSVVDRGADSLAATGIVGTGLADAFKAEARRRVRDGRFYGHIAYASVTAGKPTTAAAPASRVAAVDG